MKNELWKDIPDYEGQYKVSNLGEIFSLYHKRLLTPKKAGRGYLAITLSKEGAKKRFYIHRLVAEVFIPCKNMNDLEVNHIDLDKTNNKVANLEWCTKIDNMKHAYRSGKTDFRRPLRKDNTSGIKGVSKNGNGFQATICLNGLSLYLGWYPDLRDAENARKIAEKVAHVYEASSES